jgi:hypothetical protein
MDQLCNNLLLLMTRSFDVKALPTLLEPSSVVLNLAAIHDWEIYGLDIENAFLESNLYMNLPKDVYRQPDGTPVVVKVLEQ